jgi:hypothetical protein
VHVGAHQVRLLRRVVAQEVVQPGHKAFELVGAVDQDAGVAQSLS